MALPVWPASLPTRPLQKGTSIDSLTQPPLETESEDGPKRRRDRSAARYGEVTFNFILTPTQYNVYESFFLADLSRGKSDFVLPTYKPGLTEPFPAKIASIRFENGGPKITDDAGYVYVSLPLRIRDY